MSSKGSRRSASPTARTPKSAIAAAAPAIPFVDAGVTEDGSASAVPFADVASERAEATVEALIEAAQVAAAEASETAQAVAETTPALNTTTADAEPTTAADTIADTTQKEDTIMATNFENVATNVSPLFGDMNDRAKSAMEKTGKMAEEMTDFAKGNVEALVESSRIAAKGFESLGQDAAEYGRKSLESATATFKSFASVKSPTEFFNLQSTFMRQSFDSFVAEASKGTETMLKLAGDAAQPLSNRVAVAASKVKTAA